MSIIDNAGHSVVTYTGKEKPFTGQRLAKFSWKTVTDKSSPMYNIKRDSKCVSLPVVTGDDISNNLVVLIPHFTSFLHVVQDKMIREMLESGNSVSTVTTESISISAITEWLDSNDDSGRLTKESVCKWFDDSISESLTVVLADKLGVSDVPSNEESDKIIAVVNAFRSKISSLAGGKTVFEPKICTSVINALELAPAGDALAVRFIGRLRGMIEASKSGDELLSALM